MTPDPVSCIFCVRKVAGSGRSQTYRGSAHLHQAQAGRRNQLNRLLLSVAPRKLLETGRRGVEVYFDTWQELGRIIIVSVVSYAAIVIFLRTSGKRTLSSMNAFDLIVTVALGSAFAATILSKDVALAEGVLALFLLIVLQYVIAWLAVRFPTIRHIVKSEPTLLFHQGHMLGDALRSQRVTPEEVRAAMRTHGISQISEVEAVILETDGSFSILRVSSQPATTAHTDVTDYPPHSSLGTTQDTLSVQ